MDFNKIKEMGLEYAEKGRNAAMDLAERGRTQAKIVSEQTKLARAQRQLGALVYSLAKGNEENQPLVDKYIEMIGSIEANLNALRESSFFLLFRSCHCVILDILVYINFEAETSRPQEFPVGGLIRFLTYYGAVPVRPRSPPPSVWSGGR